MKSALALAFLGASVGAINVDFTSDASIKDGASTIAYGLMKYYNGNETGQVPGNLPKPYYWWETGALFTTLIDYWVKTGDDTYNTLTTQGLLHQVGTSNNFLPANQSKSEGNDDQGVWALAAMAAAENGFPSPSTDLPQWQDLAENVFNNFVERWDTKNCGGGLRWQIFSFNAGYDYKNSVSNGVFFDLAARLYLQTKNSTYSQWATAIFDWEQKAGLITDVYQVLQGTSTEACDNINEVPTSLDAGLFLHGSAAMYNATTSKDWKTRVDGLLKAVPYAFVDSGILVEVGCETQGTCSIDMQAYKGFLVRSLEETSRLAVYTGATIQPLLLANAKAAANACSGSPSSGFAGQSGTACGFSWTASGGKTFDGMTGVGEQMNALSAVVSTLSLDAKGQPAPGSGSNGTSTGGSSKPSGTSGPGKASTTPKNSGSRVAADAMTALVVLSGVVYGLLQPAAEQRARFLTSGELLGRRFGTGHRVPIYRPERSDRPRQGLPHCWNQVGPEARAAMLTPTGPVGGTPPPFALAPAPMLRTSAARTSEIPRPCAQTTDAPISNTLHGEQPPATDAYGSFSTTSNPLPYVGPTPREAFGPSELREERIPLLKSDCYRD